MKRIVVWMLTLCAASTGSAQLSDMLVTPSTGSGTIPVFRDYPDDAALIISSSLTGLRFESNVGIVADQSAPNEGVYRIIVRPWRQTITVTMAGYRQARFTIPAQQPRAVLYYNVEPVKNDAAALVPTTLRVNNHPDAAVFVDAQQVDLSRSVPLEPGTHLVRVEKLGFQTMEREIQVSMERSFFEFELQRLTQRRVVIRSTPAGARIRINGIERAEMTPVDFFMFPGEYGLELTLPGYRTFTTQLDVRNADGNDFNFTMTRIAGDLTLNVVPATARVYIDEAEVTGRTFIPLSPGLHTIRVQANGHDTYQATFEMQEGTPLTLPIQLKAHTGSARFTIRPIDARTTLYNSANAVVLQWTGSNMVTDLPVGPYRYVVQMPGYVDQGGQVIITRDEEQDVLFVFTDQMSLAFAQQQQQALAQTEAERLEAQRQAMLAEQRRREQQRQVMQAEQRRREQMSSDGMVGSFFTGRLDNANYENNVDFTMGLGLGQYWDVPFFRIMLDVGMLALYLNEDGPLWNDTDGYGVLGLYAGGVAGPKLNLGTSGFTAFAGLGYRTSAYYLLDDEDFPSQSLNTVYAEAQVGWQSLLFFYRQGLQSTPKNQTLIEFGIMIR